MKTTSRILCAFLALVLMTGLLSPAQATGMEAIGLSLAFSQDSVRVGEAVELTLTADNAFASRGSGMTLAYDPAFLTPDLEASSAAAPFTIHGPMTMGEKTVLRISFLPTQEAAEFPAGEALATIRFKALRSAGQTGVSLEAAYLYTASLREIPLTKPTAASLTIVPSAVHIPATSIVLNNTELNLIVGEMASLNATVSPSDASDPAVTWASSNEAVAQVSGGVVKAVGVGTAVIAAAAENGSVSAACTVTVLEPYVGYTVKLPPDMAADVGDTVQIPVVIGNADGETGYNAFDIRIAYDPAVLTLVTQQLPGLTLEVEQGRIHVLGYGESRAPGTMPFVLEFQTLLAEDTQLQILEARVDHARNAVLLDAPKAAVLDDRTIISASGYPVILPSGFSGETTAVPNRDYTFREPDDYYDYTVTAWVDGKEVPVTKNSDGSYTVAGEYITGQLVIRASRTGKVYQVVLGTDMTGESTAQHGTDYTATLHKESGYHYSIGITIGGAAYTGYGISGSSYLIPGGDITGDIVFQVTKLPEDQPFPPDDPTYDPDAPTTEPETRYSVSFSGSGAGAAQGNPAIVAHGAAYILNLKKEAGYAYTVHYRMGGGQFVLLQPRADGTYLVENVTADLEFQVEKTLNLKISIHSYVALDRKTVFLVLVDTRLDDGKVFAYDGSPMYYSEAYKTWAWLTVVEGGFDKTAAEAKITVEAGSRNILEKPDLDVNETGLVDINDAQLTFDLYNGRYDGFQRISMTKFLNADINGDKTLNVKDAAAIVACIP